jgi:hypothetical protein
MFRNTAESNARRASSTYIINDEICCGCHVNKRFKDYVYTFLVEYIALMMYQDVENADRRNSSDKLKRSIIRRSLSTNSMM